MRKSPQVKYLQVLVLVLEAHHFLQVLKKKNWKRNNLDTNFAISDDELRGKFMVVNPNFRNSDRSLIQQLKAPPQIL